MNKEELLFLTKRFFICAGAAAGILGLIIILCIIGHNIPEPWNVLVLIVLLSGIVGVLVDIAGLIPRKK